MRGLLKVLMTAAVAIAATVLAPDTTFARGGGGGRGGGGRGGGGRGGSGRGGKGGSVGSKGANKSGKGSERSGLAGKSPGDYLELVQRDSAEEDRPDFLFRARWASLDMNDRTARDAALEEARNRASAERRTVRESGDHPL